tara:strand:+ start:852 stop:1337 length:486 start_codon:yes stop_codon:yes gene_type:complete
MILNITGSCKSTRKLVDSAAWSYAERLIGKRLLNTLYIDIKLVRNLTDKEGMEGSCIWDEWESKSTPRSYTIELDSSVSLRNILISLAHEFVHVKQWISGEMYEYEEPNKVRFMKKKVDTSKLNYFDYPWEIEAFGRQLGLFVRMCEDDGIAGREDMMEIA